MDQEEEKNDNMQIEDDVDPYKHNIAEKVYWYKHKEIKDLNKRSENVLKIMNYYFKEWLVN